MTTGPLVSIVLPTYNGARYLQQAIQSCMDQTYPHWELIIVDDCSTDTTPEIAARFAGQDSRVRLVRHPVNKKLPGALNTGFALAQGAYLTWTSDDNLYRPEALSAMVSALENQPQVGVVYADYSLIDDQGAVIKPVVVSEPHTLPYKACVGACFMYRRAVAEQVGPYDENLFLAEDYDFWLRAAAHFRLRPIHRDLYLYRQHSGSLTEQRRKQVMWAREQAITRSLPALPGVSAADMTQAYLHLSELARIRGDYRQAFVYWARALRRAPVLTLRRALLRGVIGRVFGLGAVDRLSKAYVAFKQKPGRR